MRQQQGFSLIELLIVVAIILIIAAISVPNLMRARMAANEASAASGIRTITTAQITYKSSFQLGYANTIAKLGPPAAGCSGAGTPAASCLVDWVVANSSSVPKSGYVFQVGVGGSGDSESYVASTFAAEWNRTGVRSFCAMEDHEIRVKFPAAQDVAADAATCTSAFAVLNN